MRRSTGWTLGLLAAFGIASGAAWAAHHEAGEGKHDKHGEGHVCEGHHGKGHHGKHFDEKDADGNGEISREEWLARAQERFSRMDGDGNGSITREEYEAAHQKMRERWKEKHKGHDEGTES